MGSQILNSRYCLVHSIRQSDYSQIFLARDLAFKQRKCVIKKLVTNPRDIPMTKIRALLFEREAYILQKLSGKHDRIPQFYRYFVDYDAYYLVQEWIRGITLQQKLRSQTKLSELETREILLDLLPVLDCIHSLGIVHRDLKPNNIILRAKDRRTVLIDFGVAKEINNETAAKQPPNFPRVGTPGYIAPEQIVGKADYSSDLYSLGLMAIHLLTGVSPQDSSFELHSTANFWHRIKATLSTNLATVIDRAIEPEPSARFTSAREMLSALQSSSTIYLIMAKTNLSSTPVKPEPRFNWTTKSWFFWSIFAGELACLWFSLNYLIPTPDYRFSISNLEELSYREPSISMPTYESTKSDNLFDLPLFSTGTQASKILAALGEPVWRKPGYWNDSIAWSYKNIADRGIDIGYLFDRQTQKLRQTEIAVPPTINLATLNYTLQTFLQVKDATIQKGLQSVYYRQTDRYSFTLRTLEGTIERNDRDRIYIGVWEADFH